jgi:hypothetical protein
MWIFSIFKRRDRLWMTLIITGMLLSCVGINAVMPPERFLLFGMRNRVVRDYGLGLIRKFANDFDHLPDIGHQYGEIALPIAVKTYTSEALLPLGMNQKYPFLAWVKSRYSPPGPSYVSEAGNVVSVRWGSGLRGQWGFNVYLRGQKFMPSTDAETYILLASDDICFITEP